MWLVKSCWKEMCFFAVCKFEIAHRKIHIWFSAKKLTFLCQKICHNFWNLKKHFRTKCRTVIWIFVPANVSRCVLFFNLRFMKLLVVWDQLRIWILSNGFQSFKGCNWNSNVLCYFLHRSLLKVKYLLIICYMTYFLLIVMKVTFDFL